jgi:hypothetical protein
VPESQDRWEKAQWGGESEAAQRYSFVFRAPEKGPVPKAILRFDRLTKNTVLASNGEGVGSVEETVWWTAATLFFPSLWTYNKEEVGCAQPGRRLQGT